MTAGTRRTFTLLSSSLLLLAPASASAADLIMNGGTMTLGGEHTYGVVSLTNGARIIVPSFNGTDRVNTGNLVIRADSITIDSTSGIVAKGKGYQGALCADGAGPSFAPLSGGRGGCSVLDSGGGGGHFGRGGRGTKDSPGSFPAGYEEDCGDRTGAGPPATCSAQVAGCRNSDGLPSIAGEGFFHSIYSSEFGAAGGDKGCLDGDGRNAADLRAGNGGGRIVLFAGNAAQTGSINISGFLTANGNRGCAQGNDSAGGGGGGTILVVGDNVTIQSTAYITAAGGRGVTLNPSV